MMATSPKSLHSAARLLGVFGGIALVAGAVGALTLVMQLTPLARALLVPGAISGEAFASDDARVQRFRSAIDGHVAQIDGRSMFFTPAAPPPPAREAAPRDDRPEQAPTRYDGPAIIAMINGSVWFADGRRLSVGAESESSLGVLSQNGPWGARVVWKGVEFDVPLFDRTTERFIESPAPAESSARSEAAAEAAPVGEGESAVVDSTDDEVDEEGAAEAPQEKDPA